MLIELAEKIINGVFAAIPYSKPQKESVNNTFITAHRGAHNNMQGLFENTLESFRLAQNVGCWGLEFDIHASLDKVFMVNHDPDLKRLWGKDLVIRTSEYSEIRRQAPNVPTLSEVISEFGKKTHLFIELKAPFSDEEVLFDNLKDLQPGVDYHLLSLEASIFKNFSKFPKQALILVAALTNIKEFCEISINEQYGGVLGSYLLLTDKWIDKLKNAQQVYGVGFVDSKNSLYREMRRGINWIYTNQAVKVCHYIKNLENL